MARATKKMKAKAKVVFTPPLIGGDTNHNVTGGSGASTSQTTYIQTAATPTGTIQTSATSTSSASSSKNPSQEPVVDFWAKYPEVHYVHSIIPDLKRGYELPDEPPLERKPVLIAINNEGYFPEKYHEDGLRITRIIVNNYKYSWAIKWKQHDYGKREIMFNIFKKYFDVPNWFMNDWCSKAAVVFKNKMKCLRTLLIKRPSIANTLDQTMIAAWAAEDWLKKSSQGKINRGMNPCGPRQNFIGRNGWRKLFMKFKMAHGRDPTPTEGIHLRYRRQCKTTLVTEDGSTQEVITVEHANPHVENREKEVQVRLAAMRLDESQPDTPMEISVLEEQKVIAEVFGISKRGKCLGLGADVEAVVPTIRARVSEDIESTSQLKGEVASLKNELAEMKTQLAAMDALKAKMDKFFNSTAGSTASTDYSLTHP